MTAPEGRYAVDLNSSAYADPYITGTPYVATKDDAEFLANALLPIVEDAGKWALLARAAEEVEHAVECQSKGWSSGSVWEQYGVQAPAFATLIAAIGDHPGPQTDTDWRAWASISSEQRDHYPSADAALPVHQDGECGCSPLYEENFGL